MTVDLGSIPASTLRRVTMGIVAEETSLTDELCTPREVENLKGTAPNVGSEMTVPRGNNRGLAPGVAGESQRGSMGSVSYETLAYQGLADINDETEIKASAFDVNLIAHYIRESIKDANKALDRDLGVVLASTSLNEEFDVINDDDAGGIAWTTLADSTPLDDISYASALAPMYDKAVVGYDVAMALRGHPQVQGRISNYSGGTRADVGELQSLLAKVLELEESDVVILNRLKGIFNSSASGFEIGRIFSTGLWIGNTADLQAFNPTHEKNRLTEQDRDIKGRLTQIAHNRYCEIKRQIVENGVTLTGTL